MAIAYCRKGLFSTHYLHVVLSFLLCFCLVLSGAVAVCLSFPRDRYRGTHLVNALGQVVLWLSIFAALTTQRIVDPYLRLSACWLLAVLTSYGVQSKFMALPRRSLRTSLILFALIAAFVLNIDTFLIYGKSGWDTLYFRPPFTHDIQRNVVIINALLRDGKSPYLPDAPFAYQLLWYQLASLFIPFFSGTTRYPFVAGVTVFTGVLFSFLLVVLLSCLRPSNTKKWIFAVFLLLVFAHGDVFYHIAGTIFEGKPSLELDWIQRNGVFYRYFSLKSMILISPQHVLFFAFWCSMLISLRVLKDSKATLYAFFTAALSLCSPILSIMVMPVVLLERSLKRQWRVVLCMGCALAWAYLTHPVFFGISIPDLLLRPTGEKFLFPAHMKHWMWSIPISFIGAMGLLGSIVLPALVLYRKKVKASWEVLFLIFGLLGFHFIVTHSEVRKYASLIGAFAAVLFLVRTVSFRNKTVIASCALLAGGFLHLRFVQFYLSEPSVVSKDIAWQDYFKVNDFLKERLPSLSVIAAVDSSLGVDKPLVMEVTRSFATPVETAIHTRLTQEKFDLMKSMHYYGQIAPFAKALGYDAVLWGPVEEHAWGAKIKSLLIDEKRLLFREGKVALYRLEK